MPSPSASPPPTEATKLKAVPSQRSRAAQVGLGLPGKPSKRQVLAEAPPVERVTPTKPRATSWPPFVRSTRKRLQAAGSKSASAAAPVKVATSGLALHTQPSVEGKVASSVSFR